MKHRWRSLRRGSWALGHPSSESSLGSSVKSRVAAHRVDPELGVLHCRLRACLVGSDGSTLVLELSVRLTVDANGRVVVDRAVAACG